MKKRPLTELNVLDNFLFNELAMQDDPEKAKRFFKILLETILQKQVTVTDIVPQKIIQGREPSLHGIQQDSYVEAYVCDGEETNVILPIPPEPEIFDIEPNTYETGSEEKRMRYYLSLIDTKLLLSGADYSKLKRVTLIMISTYDLFGMGKMVYTIRRHIEENPTFSYDDGTTILYLYTKGKSEKGQEKLTDLLTFLADSNRENAVSSDMRELYQMIDSIKLNSAKGVKYMKSWEIEDYCYKQGVNEGFQNGRATGIQEGRAAGLRDGRAAGISVPELEAYLIKAKELPVGTK